MARKKSRGDVADDGDASQSSEASTQQDGAATHGSKKNQKAGKKGKNRGKVGDDDDYFQEDRADIVDAGKAKEVDWEEEKLAEKKKTKKGEIPVEDDESDDEQIPSGNNEKGRKGAAEKKGKKTGAVGFSLLREFTQDVEEEEEEEEIQVEKKEKLGGFGLLAGDGVMEDEIEDNKHAVKPSERGKKGKKKNEDFWKDFEEDLATEEEQEGDSKDGVADATIAVKGGKKGKGKKTKHGDFDDDFSVEEEGKDQVQKEPEDKAIPLVVGEIASCKRVPKSDKLKICMVDVGKDGLVQVVCGGKNAREGIRVILASVGSLVPATGVKLQKAKIKGVDSFGMICSGKEMGWAEDADEVVELDSEFELGSVAPVQYPKKALPIAENVAGHILEQDEGENDVIEFVGKKKKKGGKESKKGNESENFAVEVSALENEEAEEMGEEAIFQGKKKGKGKKAITVIKDENSISEEDGKVEELLMFTGKKKGKKAKDKGGFASLKVGDEVEGFSGSIVEDVEGDKEEGELIEYSGKKLSNGKQGVSLEAFSEVEVTSTEDECGEPGDETFSFTGKKKKKGTKGTSRSVLSTFDGEHEEELEEEHEELTFAGKGKGREKKQIGLEADESNVMKEGRDATMEDHSIKDEEDPKEKAVGDLKKKGKKGKGKGAGKDVHGEEDIDAILAILEGPKQSPNNSEGVSIAPSLPAVSSSKENEGASGKKGKKGKKGRTKEEEVELDAILAELDGPREIIPSMPTDVKELKSGKEGANDIGETKEEEEKKKEEGEEGGDEEGEEGEGGGGVESAAAKKKRKKKEKEKAKALAAKAGNAVDGAETAEKGAEREKGPKKDDKKLPKHVREMQERLARLKEAEEKQKREEEERRKREEEEAARLAEQERLKEEAKQRRKEREKEKKAQLKKEGKLLTAKQKEEARKLQSIREKILAERGLLGVEEGEQEEGTAAPKKKVVYDRKKKSSKKAEPAVEPLPPPAAELGGKVEYEAPELIPVAEVAESEEEVVEEEKAEELKTEEKVVEEEDDDEWDDKAWDDENVELPVLKRKGAFDEDEEEEVKNVKTKQASATTVVEKEKAGKLGTGKALTDKKKKKTNEDVEEDSEGSDESDEEDYDEGSDEEDESGSDDEDTKRKVKAKEMRVKRKEEAMKNRSADDLRSPICCILGHVDTGKTKVLDCIRRTNVQEGEAGGITQQIGATYFPMDSIKERTKELKADATLKVPGLLIIDTPGHESFTNLRARGSGLCDIAILVVDIMHGMEPQTIESLNLLKMRKTPFVVAMNKVDRIYGWRPTPNAPIRSTLKQQPKDALQEFEMRTEQVITELKQQGLNAALYYKNPDVRKYLSIVPTSAISGEGIPDLLLLLVQLTQKLMEDRLMYISEVQCTVLEVKVVEGLGTTIDVVLVNGVLHEGDQIVVCGLQGPIVTSIRALLTPHPMKELRVKGSYLHHKELKAAQGIKITAQGLEHAVAGTQLYVVGPEDDVDAVKEEAMEDVKGVLSRVDKTGEGVCVQASTLGSLEALLEFLKSPAVQIPVSGIAIGPVHKKDVMRASVMLERKRKEFAVILAFDVKVSTEAREMAEELGVRIFTADIIYHLFDQFTAYMQNVKDEKRKDAAEEAVFPVVLKILPNCIFNKKDPIVLGVEIVDGIAKIGTPICVPGREFIDIGKIASIEKDHKVVDVATKGQAVAMKIVGSNPEEVQKSYGRHFDSEDELVSRISRKSIDLLKENYRDDLSRDEWILVVKLKKLFDIQ